MFEGFANQWTPVLPSADVTSRPRRVVVAGEALVLWRPTRDTVGVLLDRCPHRGVSLALGSRTDAGDLACAFHGWEFAADGSCRHIPFNPDAARHRMGALALPHREIGGLVWVYTRADATAHGEPDTEPHVVDSLTDPGLTRFYHHEVWDAHWTRAMENMLDYPHLPYVHRSTIGRFVRAKARRDSRLRYDLEHTAYGYRFGTRLDDHPPSAHLRWYRPNSMVLDTMPAPRMLRIQVFCIPEERNRVRMLLVTARNFARNPAASLAFDRVNLTVLHQDRSVVESSDPVEVPDARAERSVPTDRPTLEFRTWYLRECRAGAPDADRMP